MITKGGKDETFTAQRLDREDRRDRDGAHVTVHYTMDGKNMVATAVAVQPAKGTPKGKK